VAAVKVCSLPSRFWLILIWSHTFNIVTVPLTLLFGVCVLAAEEVAERAPGERLLRRPEQLPEDAAAGGRQRERLRGQSQGVLQGVGE